MVFVLPILAVMLSFVFVYFTRPKNEKHIKLLLAFSGAFLLALTFFELLPEMYQSSNSKTIALYILAGLLLQVFLEFFSKGAEHGHVHLDLKQHTFPIILFLSLSLHAIIEGIPTIRDGGILYGILVHKIPVAIILSIFLLNSNLKLSLTILFISLFAIMTPLGGYLALNSSIVSGFETELSAITIGVFLHISTVVLFESSQGHAFNLRKLVVIALGISTAYFM